MSNFFRNKNTDGREFGDGNAKPVLWRVSNFDTEKFPEPKEVTAQTAAEAARVAGWAFSQCDPKRIYEFVIKYSGSVYIAKATTAKEACDFHGLDIWNCDVERRAA